MSDPELEQMVQTWQQAAGTADVAPETGAAGDGRPNLGARGVDGGADGSPPDLTGSEGETPAGETETEGDGDPRNFDELRQTARQQAEELKALREWRERREQHERNQEYLMAQAQQQQFTPQEVQFAATIDQAEKELATQIRLGAITQPNAELVRAKLETAKGQLANAVQSRQLQQYAGFLNQTFQPVAREGFIGRLAREAGVQDSPQFREWIGQAQSEDGVRIAVEAWKRMSQDQRDAQRLQKLQQREVQDRRMPAARGTTAGQPVNAQLKKLENTGDIDAAMRILTRAGW